MLKQSLKLWHFWIAEPYSWLKMSGLEAANPDEPLPEKLERGYYFQCLLRLALPFFTVAYPLAVIALPVFALWYGEAIPHPFPFVKLAWACAVCEGIALGVGAFGRTQLTFLLTIGLGLAFTVGLGSAIASF